MSQAVWFVFSAGGAVTAACLSTALLRWRPTARRHRRVAAGLAAFYLVASLHVVPDLVGRVMVGGLRPLRAADLPAGPLTIVVLGAGSITVHDWEGHRYVTTDPHASSRVLEAVRLFRMAPSATVISSGGLPSPDARGTATGEAMAGALVALGVPASRLRVETTARNTHEEALVITRVLASGARAPIVLVTLDVHMRRAVGAFAAAGTPVIPAIAQSPDADLRTVSRWLPSSEGLGHSGLIAHELLGIAYYSARGWFRTTPPRVGRTAQATVTAPT